MRKPSTAIIIASLALFVSLGGVGVAASGTDFILGRNNTAKAKTSLTAPVAGNSLQITNTLPGGSALGLSVDPASPPFTTNSSTKVPNLNSDLLDGQNSTAFLGVNGTAANANKLDGLDSTQFLGANGTAANANKLDGLDSTQFVQGGGSVSTIHATLDTAANNHNFIELGTLSGSGQPIADLSGQCYDNFNGQTGANIWLVSVNGTITLLREGSQGATTVITLSNIGIDQDMPVLPANHFKWHGHWNNLVFTIDTWTYKSGLTCTYDIRFTVDP
jgi:hypothetical protein